MALFTRNDKNNINYHEYRLLLQKLTNTQLYFTTKCDSKNRIKTGLN